VFTPEQVTKAIVVLGFQLNPDGTMTASLARRLDYAVQLYQQGVAPVIIVSGWYAIDIPELSQYCEAEVMQSYLYHTYGITATFKEPDSKSIPENLLFTRVRFPNLQELVVITGELSVERTGYLAWMIFGNHAQVACHSIADGAGNPERQSQLVGDAKCTLQRMTAGDISFLLLPPSADGRLQSKWDVLRTAHHVCPYWRKMHPHPFS
jgi:hypothetical protein